MNISANEGDNTDSCKNNINISQNDNNWPIIITNNSITLSKDNCSLLENNQKKIYQKVLKIILNYKLL